MTHKKTTQETTHGERTLMKTNTHTHTHTLTEKTRTEKNARNKKHAQKT